MDDISIFTESINKEFTTTTGVGYLLFLLLLNTKIGGHNVFDFGNANEGQRLAISTADGPVLITAGPGTGKTFTLVQRAIYLIQECGVAPE